MSTPYPSGPMSQAAWSAAVSTPTPTWTVAEIAHQADPYPQMIHGGERIFVLAFLLVILPP